MKMRPRILVVEDDQALRELIVGSIEEWGFDALASADASEAMEALGSLEPDVILSDVIMPGMSGRDLLAEIRAREPDVPVILMTAFAEVDKAVNAVHAGAFDYLSKPFSLSSLRSKLEEAVRMRALRRAAGQDAVEFDPAQNVIVARSAGMRGVLAVIRRAAVSDTPVLLVGESGTGKELLARTLHASSRRAHGRFLAVNCSAIPDNLLESELFGYRRGAFTDAREDRRGLLQETSGGTLLLDEIGDMPLALQAKLLRVIQEREVHPLGAPLPVPVDIRWVAATHRDISAMVQAKQFREDLYYRLNVISVAIPPLRSRPEDIVPLIEVFIAKHAKLLGRPPCRIAPETLDVIRRHSWPGNVRELENVIERSLVLGDDDVIGVDDLPPHLRDGRGTVDGSPLPQRSLADVEREHVLPTLRLARGNKAAAARVLGMDRKTLYRKLDEYGEV